MFAAITTEVVCTTLASQAYSGIYAKLSMQVASEVYSVSHSGR